MSATIVAHSHSLFTVTFNNNTNIITTVTASGIVVDAWVRRINHEARILRSRVSQLIAGLRVEPQSEDSRVALLQLCFGRHCLLFHLCYTDFIPFSLRRFVDNCSLDYPSLDNPTVCFLGTEIHTAVRRLSADYNLEVHNILDLGSLATWKIVHRPELRLLELRYLTQEVIGVFIEKPLEIRRSTYHHQPLSYDEVIYASVEAYLSFELGRRLLAWR